MSERRPLRITYLISSILGVTGGNQTLLQQANAMVDLGHTVTIVTKTPRPTWFDLKATVIQVPEDQLLALQVPPSDVVIATYFTNANELILVDAPVKVYYAQGDQYVFEDHPASDDPRAVELFRRMGAVSQESYLNPTVRFVANSRNLAGAVERSYGRKADAILPVCTDQRVFRPLQRARQGSRIRILVVGPDYAGTPMEPLTFKGIGDIRQALELLAKRQFDFTTIRMSGSGPQIFADFPCEFYQAPSDEMKTFLYGTADILVYASHYDSCPRPPQEAMAAGAAVVCTATPGAMEYARDGYNSLLVPIADPNALAQAIERLIVDPELRARLAANGLETARQYPVEREWNEMEALLQRFMAEATPERQAREYNELGERLFAAGRLDGALFQFERGLGFAPNDPTILNNLGVIAYDAGAWNKATDYFQRALEAAPSFAEARENLAQCQEAQRGLTANQPVER